MSYLSFQPAFDVFHAEFRFLRLRRLMLPNTQWHFDQLRIIDFYLLFFFRLADARLLPKHRSYKKLSSAAAKGRYENQPDDHIIFGRMEPMQRAAAATLVANDFFLADPFAQGFVAVAEKKEPNSVSARIDSINEQEATIMTALQSLATDYELLGPNGLKARTQLLEFRYDSI